MSSPNSVDEAGGAGGAGRAGRAATLAFAFALTACASRSVHPAPPAQPARPALAALRSQLDAILNDSALAHGTWGVVAKSLRTGETLYAMNAQKLLMPASNMKIVTLAAAADRLGWDYTYQTRVFADGRIADGTLTGDLVVVGSGDPSLGIADGSADRVFGEWAARLQQLGVRTIAGRIVGDDNAFEDQTLGFGWSWDDLADDYAAGVGALQFNENAVRVSVAPGPASGDAAAVSMEPPASGVDVVSAATTGAVGTQTSLRTRRLPGTERLEISGVIAAGASPSTLTVSVDNPTLFFVRSLKRALVAHGIDVRGDAVDIDEIADAPSIAGAAPIATYRSAPLSTLAVRLMKASQNQYAETLLKTLSASPETTASAAAGRAVERTVFDAWGVPASGLIVRDGSGLSRYDYVTAETIVTILSHVYADARLRAPFEASLPVAGQDGTLGSRMKASAADGKARAKTGSMSNVRALSGYLTTADGEPVAFSILANNFETTADVVNKAADAVVVRLATFRR